MGHTMGVPKTNRKKTGFENWQEGRNQAQTSVSDDHAVLQADSAKLVRCAARWAIPISVPHIRACCPLFHVLCCLHLFSLLHPRASPDKAHPPEIDVIRRHRIYCVNW